ncbi:sensor histidine kinase [Viridibacillus arvi]|uniref:sensor histidine kinase n=1 Tax=Viridibacillus arvi TaxID=263475 RepID=UPI003D02F607
MFNRIRKKLTMLYAACYFLFILVFIVVLYFSLTKLMENEQIKELESYYLKEQHDFFEHKNDKVKHLSYDPNRDFFYYIYTKDHVLVHGNESYKELYKELENMFQQENIAKSTKRHLEWHEQHFLLLKKPIKNSNKVEGYIILGKSITTQYHFFQKMSWLLIVLTCIFSLFIGLLSNYLAGKAMIPIKQSFDKQKKFVSDASHELRTPLSVFYSSLDLLETDEAKKLSPFGKELIVDLKEESQLMKDLLEKLLFLARHDQNQFPLKMEVTPLSELLTNLGNKFERTITSSVTFTQNINKNIKFYCDSTRIQELIYILLDNAVQYTGEGTISLTLVQEESSIKILVQDTGTGIHPEDLPLIFNRFYRSDSARESNGTGLGLSIAKAIVEQHNGTINVTSQIGQGTTFTISFPTL